MTTPAGCAQVLRVDNSVPKSTKATPADLARLDAVTAAICKECASMPAAGGNPSGADVCKLFQTMGSAAKTIGNAPNWAKLDELGAQVPCVAAALKSANLPAEISGSDKTLTYVAYGVGAVVGIWILYKLL